MASANSQIKITWQSANSTSKLHIIHGSTNSHTTYNTWQSANSQIKITWQSANSTSKSTSKLHIIHGKVPMVIQNYINIKLNYIITHGKVPIVKLKLHNL